MKLEPGGRYEVFPDPPGLIEFINRVRDNERALTTTHLVLSIKANQREWLNNYLATKQQSTSYDSLLCLLQHFCDRHGFFRQRPTKNKVKQADLAESHVLGESYNIMYEELGAHLCALSPNATSVYQPLDVGVMAPFKRNLRNLWLLEDIIVGDDDDPFSLTSRQKRMALVKRSIAAWDLVSSQEIRRSFEKALPH
ncbi:hypothetical protein DYB37_013835 [Aphanomyces astaci]|uniref:DDE-1 domain-containing protein n=1 Tax=Aphanomyces astaci TaxID=112090 RepID=A0A3R7AMU1_APHAT|nr:hypothetical protein DYB37_013835 [Aphanomyces astaci]